MDEFLCAMWYSMMRAVKTLVVGALFLALVHFL